MSKIIIEGKEFKVKSTVRTMIYFEKNMKKQNVTDVNSFEGNVVLMYSTLQANNRDEFKYSYDEFLDILDENPDVIEQVMNGVQSQDVMTEDKESSEKK